MNKVANLARSKDYLSQSKIVNIGGDNDTMALYVEV
jgi:hypothetical protein